MRKFSMWKPEANSKTLPTRLHPVEGQQKKIQYPRYHKGTARKGFWNGEDNEVPWGNRDI